MKLELEKIRDSEVEKYDDNFQFTGSYSSCDMDQSFKAGFDACFKVLNEELKKVKTDKDLMDFINYMEEKK